jgi:lipoprotein signal peptidase
MIKYGDKKMLWLGAFLVFLIDQCTKVWASTFLPLDHEIVVNHLFSLHRVFNDSYIMMNYNIYESKFALQNATQFKIVYTSISVFLCSAIIWVTNQPALKDKSVTVEFLKTGLFFIVGGTIGNAFDRLFRAQGVIDFVRVKDGDNYDFIFNFADLAVYMGEFCILVGWSIVILSLLNNKLGIFSIPKTQSLD